MVHIAADVVVLLFMSIAIIGILDQVSLSSVFFRIFWLVIISDPQNSCEQFHWKKVAQLKLFMVAAQKPWNIGSCLRKLNHHQAIAIGL